MKPRKLITASLADALKGMAVGETCIAPDGYSPQTVRKTCSELRREGLLFKTSTHTDTQTISRIK